MGLLKPTVLRGEMKTHTNAWRVTNQPGSKCFSTCVRLFKPAVDLLHGEMENHMNAWQVITKQSATL